MPDLPPHLRRRKMQQKAKTRDLSWLDRVAQRLRTTLMRAPDPASFSPSTSESSTSHLSLGNIHNRLDRSILNESLLGSPRAPFTPLGRNVPHSTEQETDSSVDRFSFADPVGHPEPLKSSNSEGIEKPMNTFTPPRKSLEQAQPKEVGPDYEEIRGLVELYDGSVSEVEPPYDAQNESNDDSISGETSIKDADQYRAREDSPYDRIGFSDSHYDSNQDSNQDEDEDENMDNEYRVDEAIEEHDDSSEYESSPLEPLTGLGDEPLSYDREGATDNGFVGSNRSDGFEFQHQHDVIDLVDSEDDDEAHYSDAAAMDSPEADDVADYDDSDTVEPEEGEIGIEAEDIEPLEDVDPEDVDVEDVEAEDVDGEDVEAEDIESEDLEVYELEPEPEPEKIGSETVDAEKPGAKTESPPHAEAEPSPNMEPNEVDIEGIQADLNPDIAKVLNEAEDNGPSDGPEQRILEENPTSGMDDDRTDNLLEANIEEDENSHLKHDNSDTQVNDTKHMTEQHGIYLAELGEHQPEEVQPQKEPRIDTLNPAERYVGFDFRPSLSISESGKEDDVDPITANEPNHELTGHENDQAELSNNFGNTNTGEQSVEQASSTVNNKSNTGTPSLPSQEEVDENPYYGMWNLFSVGFSVELGDGNEPPASTSEDTNLINSQKEEDIDPQAELESQAAKAQRILSSAPLFGGRARSPVSPTKLSDASPDQKESSLSDISRTALDLLGSSSLFGGHPPVQEGAHAIEQESNRTGSNDTVSTRSQQISSNTEIQDDAMDGIEGEALSNHREETYKGNSNDESFESNAPGLLKAESDGIKDGHVASNTSEEDEHPNTGEERAKTHHPHSSESRRSPKKKRSRDNSEDLSSSRKRTKSSVLVPDTPEERDVVVPETSRHSRALRRSALREGHEDAESREPPRIRSRRRAAVDVKATFGQEVDRESPQEEVASPSTTTIHDPSLQPHELENQSGSDPAQSQHSDRTNSKGSRTKASNPRRSRKKTAQK